MQSKADEFLEELKDFCKESEMKACCEFEDKLVYSTDIIEMIEKFQTEQKQASNDNQ